MARTCEQVGIFFWIREDCCMVMRVNLRGFLGIEGFVINDGGFVDVIWTHWY